MRLCGRMRLGFALVGATGAALVAVDAGVVVAAQAHRGGASAARCAAAPAAAAADPYVVARRFLRSAVERKNLARAYGLSTEALRGGRSCAQWVHGNVPVPQVGRIDWARTGYAVVAGGDGQLILRVFLFRPGTPLPAPFLMELRQDAGSWQVGTFSPDGAYSSPSSGPAA